MRRIFDFLRVKEEDRSLLCRIYFIFLCSGAVSTLTGAILPDIQASYGLSYELRGFLLSSQQVGNFMAVLVAGFLPYVIGRKLTAVLLPSLIVLGLLLMTLSGNPLLLVLAFICTGVGRGTLSNTTNVVVSECAENKSAGLNLLHATFAVGAFISPFVAIAIGGEMWRISAILFAIVMAMGILAIALSTLRSAREERRKGGESVPFLRDFSYWNILLILFTYLCAESSLMGWLVTYFQESGMMSPALAKSMQSLLWIMILLGRLLCASLSGKVKSKSSLILSLGIMMTLCFLLMVSSSSLPLVVAALLGTGFCMSGIYPTALSTQKSEYTKSTVATGFCIAFATVGAFIWPSVVGHVAAVAGIRGGIASITIALVLMVLLMIVKRVREG